MYLYFIHWLTLSWPRGCGRREECGVCGCVYVDERDDGRRRGSVGWVGLSCHVPVATLPWPYCSV